MSYITDPSYSQLHITGNSGGAVFPVSGGWQILGSGAITTTGNPLLGTLTITASGVVPTSFTADSGVAVPALGVLKLIGATGGNISTVGSSNQVEFKISGTTPYAVQIGSATNGIQSLTVGTNGQILVGSTGASPVFYTLGTTNGINSTIGSGTLSIGGITASTTQIGVSLLATDAEAIAGTDTAHNLTPSNLTAKLGTQTQYALPVGAGTTAALGWLAVGANGEGLMGNTGANPGWTSSPSFGGTVTAATGMTITLGDLTVTSGNVLLPTTTSTVGALKINSVSVLHAFGTGNIFLGDSGNRTLTNASYNTAVGKNALITLGGTTASDGLYNVAVGYESLKFAVDSIACVCLGYGAGKNYTSNESYNIILGANAGLLGESNVFRVGSGTGIAAGQLNKSYIAGIYNRTPIGTLNIALIDSNDQLGSTATLPNSMGGGIVWHNVTGTSQSAAVSNGYLANNGSLVTITLPLTAAVLDIVKVIGAGAGGWKIAQNSGQTIHFGSRNTTTGTGGYLASTVQYDSVSLMCITANTDWVVFEPNGTITVV